MDEALRRLISLLRHPSIKDQPVTTLGELADRLEQVYHEKYFRPARRPVGNLGDQVAGVFPRTRNWPKG